MSLKKAYILVILVLLIDQISKIYIKTNFVLDESIRVMGLDWFRIHFIENEGMAWGAKIPSWLGGKLTLTLFRIAAVGAIGWWLYDSVKKHLSPYLIVSIALILSGAFGNIIDSVFYGVIFDHSNGQLATLFADDPYGTLFHGKVVDMFYFPLWRGNLPSWLPIWGGQEFSFFNAIFNVADAAISVGVGILIVFNKRAFAKPEPAVQENITTGA
ncbi:lipoprotein signal peptidase [Flavobacterium coralii]|uniref:lipoprotein signal peptidase n=1 Tax=Flavobacterium coralii TaxID=2838017 RepID=UPI000C5BF92B|nr:lipoprotein signal peptidase [Flavobacterium sp.]|tara:strand:+ start:104278 stop:104919 length:642 start_codon:yes stop_codon:yes gene_type:complete